MKHILLLVFTFTSTLITSQAQVVGGQHATDSAYPWMVGLRSNGQHICGASLITPYWVLTAGHCGEGLPPFIPAPDEVWVNHYSHTNPNGHAELIEIDSIILHPDFDINSSNLYDDIALIKLKTPASFAPIAFATLDDTTRLSAGAPCRALGWGSINANGDQSDTLKQADIEIFSLKTCDSLHTQSDITPQMVCAGFQAGEPQAGAGAGDSGGPLVMDVNGEWVQIGVVSFGIGQVTAENEPGVYTNVARYADWINSVIQSVPTGLEDQVLPHSVKAWMAHNQINLKLQQPIHELLDLKVYNMLGEVLYTGTIDGHQTQETSISLRPNSHGIHLLSITTRHTRQQHVVKLFQ